MVCELVDEAQIGHRLERFQEGIPPTGIDEKCELTIVVSGV